MSTKRDQPNSRRNTKIIEDLVTPGENQNKENETSLIVTVTLASAAAISLLTFFIVLLYRKRRQPASQVAIGNMLYFNNILRMY